MWCFACDRLIPTLPGYASLYIPGQPTTPGAVALMARNTDRGGPRTEERAPNADTIHAEFNPNPPNITEVMGGIGSAG